MKNKFRIIGLASIAFIFTLGIIMSSDLQADESSDSEKIAQIENISSHEMTNSDFATNAKCGGCEKSKEKKKEECEKECEGEKESKSEKKEKCNSGKCK